jgi:hypothetical protein
MINTVPSGVTLSEVVKPVPVKPKIYFSLTSDGRLQLSGEVRVRSTGYLHEWSTYHDFSSLTCERIHKGLSCSNGTTGMGRVAPIPQANAPLQLRTPPIKSPRRSGVLSLCGIALVSPLTLRRHFLIFGLKLTSMMGRLLDGWRAKRASRFQWKTDFSLYPTSLAWTHLIHQQIRLFSS